MITGSGVNRPFRISIGQWGMANHWEEWALWSFCSNERWSEPHDLACHKTDKQEGVGWNGDWVSLIAEDHGCCLSGHGNVEVGRGVG